MAGAEVVLDLDHVPVTQRAGVVDLGRCGEVDDADVGAEFVCPVLLEEEVEALEEMVSLRGSGGLM